MECYGPSSIKPPWNSCSLSQCHVKLPNNTPKNIGWLVVGPPLWKIWKSIGMIIPNIWENKIDVPNHQPVGLLDPFVGAPHLAAPSSRLPTAWNTTVVAGSQPCPAPNELATLVRPHMVTGKMGPNSSFHIPTLLPEWFLYVDVFITTIQVCCFLASILISRYSWHTYGIPGMQVNCLLFFHASSSNLPIRPIRKPRTWTW